MRTTRKRSRLTVLLLFISLLEFVVIVFLLLPSGQTTDEPAKPAAESLQWVQSRNEPQVMTMSQLAASAYRSDTDAGDQPEAEPEVPEVVEKEKPAGERSAAEIMADAQVIAHGMGAINGLTTPNCLEGFLIQYNAGVRVFEADLRLTRDVKNVLRHDWWNASWQNGIDWVHVPTREKFVSEKILDKYTPLSFQGLLRLMEAYPDICIITDTKFTESDVFSIQFDSMLADARELGLTYLFDRIVVQVYSKNMHTGLDNIYPFPHYIYTLYQDEFKGTKEAFRERAAYCAKQGIEGIAMDEYWWKPDFAAIADEYGIRVYVHTVNDAAAAKKLLNSGCDGIYSDSLTPGSLS